MEAIIKVAITTAHMKKSHGYIFDDCPLKLAIQDAFPTAFVNVGGPKVVIILDKRNDKVAWNYKPSSNYSPAIDSAIGLVKKAGGDFYMEVILTLIGTQYNYFQHETNEDYIKECSNEEIKLPENLFSE